MVLITIFAIVVLAIVGKLIYDVQQKKNKPTQTEDGFDKEALQKLAGIKPINENDELRQILVKNNFPKEQIVEALLKAAENSEFPKQDETINVRTTKITTINRNFGSDSDPLAQIPMSRVSAEAKQKMAEIAKKDIQRQLDEQVIPDSVRESAQKELDEMNEIVMGTIGSKPKTQTDYRREHSKEFESAVRDVIITTLKEKHKKK